MVAHPMRVAVLLRRITLLGLCAGLFILARAGHCSAEDAATSVGVDLSTLDAQTHKEIDGLDLEKAAVLRLIQEGFPVVNVGASPAVLISIRRVPEGLLIEARGPGGVRRGVLPLGPSSLAELHLAVVQRIVSLAQATSRSPAASPVAASPSPVPPHAPAPTVTPAPSPPAADAVAMPAKAEARMELEAAAGWLWRGSARDLLAKVAWRYATVSGLLTMVSLGFAPSSGDGIAVREWQPQLGLGYRGVLHAEVQLDAVLAVGLLTQQYQLEQRAAADAQGTLVDILATLPIRLGYAPFAHVGVALEVAPGIASRHHHHRDGSQELWARSVWRLESGLTLFGRW